MRRMGTVLAALMAALVMALATGVEAAHAAARDFTAHVPAGIGRYWTSGQVSPGDSATVDVRLNSPLYRTEVAAYGCGGTFIGSAVWAARESSPPKFLGGAPGPTCLVLRVYNRGSITRAYDVSGRVYF